MLKLIHNKEFRKKVLIGVAVLIFFELTLMIALTVAQKNNSQANTDESTSGSQVALSETNESTDDKARGGDDLGSQENTSSSEMQDGANKRTAKENPFNSCNFLSSSQYSYFAVLYLDDESKFTTSNSVRTPAADVIHVFILEYIFEQVQNGNISLDSMIAGQTLESLITAMIQNSDNTATNVLIDSFGMANMNSFFAEAGYTDTVLQCRMADEEARASGLENYTSLNDCLIFLEHLYENRTTYPHSNMLEIMQKQTVSDSIVAGIPATVTTATKSGELSDVQNDIGIVFAGQSSANRGDFIIICLSYQPTEATASKSGITELASLAYEFSLS